MAEERGQVRDGFHLYQWLILATLAAAVIGAYGILIHLVVSRLHPARPPREVRLVSPADGTVVAVGGAVHVQAAVKGLDIYRLELWVDSAPVHVATRSLPADAAPWIVSAEWGAGWPGIHTATVRGLTPKGEMVLAPEHRVMVVPDGEVLFASNRDGKYGLYRMRLDGTNLEQVFAGPGDSREPAVNQFGEVVFVHRLAGQHRSLWTVRAAEPRASVWREEMANLQQPAWSPDGQWVAFVSDVNGKDQVWIARADGSDAHPLTDESSAAGQPCWSRDGTRLVYTVREDGNWDLVRVSRDGSGRVVLTRSPAVDWQPACSPVGDQIAFASNRTGAFQVYVMDMAGSNLRQLTDLAGGAEQPRWSPDGSWLIFVSYGGNEEGLNGRELFLMRSDGREIMRLTNNGTDDTEPAWLRMTSEAVFADAGAAVMDLDAAYYDNMTCWGEPVVRRREAVIDSDWGLGSPFPQVPADHFSVCWTGAMQVPSDGMYILEASADDGIRVWLDDVQIAEAWGRQGLQELRLPLHISAGGHTIRVEYYDLEGSARVRVRWTVAP